MNEIKKYPKAKKRKQEKIIDVKTLMKMCSIQGNNTCACFHFCTLCGDQVDSIFS